MFYSQFILAKKGPLGTIWIAAHLERKLRKNQVADTDISVSVDSILFPEVPIALRLSSHLLLGVVRIYSRKVNYLFNDCSETLVKIKQAFRSTAVDLPPEASTAPYHSITLPETFDLDDLELPDSSFCHGNFVDHHVTTREQITLQDPVEDSIYLGSQFGLDERFGDGDAPQMGLDFDEDLFADRICSPGPSTTGARLEEEAPPPVPAEEAACSNKMEAEEHQSCIPGIDFDHGSKDEAKGHSTLQSLPYQSGKQIDSKAYNVLQSPVLEVVQVSGKDTHTPDLNEEIVPSATAQGPSTPGLTDEALTAHVEEVTVVTSSNKSPVFGQIESVTPAAAIQAAMSPTFCAIPHLSMRFEQVDVTTSSQQCSPAFPSTHVGVGQIQEVDAKLLVKEQTQPIEEQVQSAEMEPVIKQSMQHPIMFCTSENVNLASISSPLQPVMGEPCKEMPMLASNLSSASSPLFGLTIPMVPSSFANSYELNASMQQLPIREFVAPATTLPLTRAISNPQEASAACLQPPNLVADGKQQLHSAAGPQQYARVIQPASLPISSLSMPTAPLTSALSYELNASKQKLPIPESLAPATVQQFAPTISNTWDVSTMHFQQLNLLADNKQQPHSAAEPTDCAQVIQSVSSPSFNLTMPTVPSTSAHSYELNASKQQLPMWEFPASTTSQQFATTILNTRDVSAVNFQQVNMLADNKRQQHSAAEPQEFAQVIQPVSSPVSSLTMPAFPSTSACSYELNVCKGQLPIREFPAPLASPMSSLPVPTVPSAPALCYELNASKQQLSIQEFPPAVTSPIFSLRMPMIPSTSAHFYEVNLSKQQSSIQEFPAPVTSLQSAAAISNKQEVSMVHFSQPNLVEDGKQELHSAARPEECGQVMRTENSSMKISPQDVVGMCPLIGTTPTTQAFPRGLAGQQFNLASGYDSNGSVAGAQQLPITVNKSEHVNNIGQEFSLPQRLHIRETFGSVQGQLLRECSEGVHPWQSLHLIGSGQDSLAQGIQQSCSRPEDTATISVSAEIQRIPTNVPPEFVSSQSCSFPLPIGMQALSKGIPHESISTQHFSFPSQAGLHGIPADAPSENILLQDCGLPSLKIIESKGFSMNVPASNVLTPMTSQPQRDFNMSDELSNALSVSVQKNVTASKDEQSETIQSLPQTATLISQIPAHETLRSAFNAVREEPDIFGLKQPTMDSKTPREVEKSAIPTKQSIGKKRHIMDTTPVLKEDTPNSMVRSPFSNRSMDYLPHDDDVLASILGRTPAFKVRPTPAETVAPKRLRPTPRATVLKRKALIDVAMLLHGDVIRQQLVNTEDIRRVRKKAPCTRRETWVLQKESQAQQIFWEPSIPGLCMELCDLYDQVFGLNGVKLPHADMNENSAETQKTQEPRSNMEPAAEFRAVELESVTLERSERAAEMVSVIGSGGMDMGYASKKKACEATSQQSPSEGVLEMNGCPREVSEVNMTHDCSMIASLHAEQVLDNIVAVLPQDNAFADCEVAGIRDPSLFQNECNNSMETNWTNCEPPVEHKEGLNFQGEDHETPVENRGARCLVENHELPVVNKNLSDFLSEGHKVPLSLPSEDAPVEPVGEFGEVNNETELMNKESDIVSNAKEQIEDIVAIEQTATNVTTEETLQENECENQAATNGTTEVTFQENECKNKAVHDRETCIVLQDEECLPNIGSNNGVLVDQNMGKALETLDAPVQVVVVENAKQDDLVVGHEMSTELDHKTAEEIEAGVLVYREASDELTQKKVLAKTQEDKATVDTITYDDDGERDDDFDFLGQANNIEFLVADDEAQAETDVNNNVYDVEEDQIQENSGWSARTRAVSRYLKTVFDVMDCNSKKAEAESQQKLGLDRLLVGKTRREAARMFFETLVLKTRDYVHVEQKNSFDDITVYPRPKLMKTNF